MHSAIFFNVLRKISGSNEKNDRAKRAQKG